MERWRIVFPILLAAVIALVGSLLTYRWVKTQVTQEPQVVVEQRVDTVPIAVATADIPWGTRLDLEDVKHLFELVPYLQDTLPPGSFKDLAELEGRVLMFPVKQSEPVLESALAPVTVRTGGVAAILKPGMRALAVKGDKVIGLSGFVQPGNRVDVLVTLEDPRSKRDVTKLVLQDVPVLATGTEMQEDSKGKPMPVDVYTLEVSPEDGEKLALVATLGSIQLALRSVLDTETVRTQGATVTAALDSYRVAPQVPVARKPWRPPPPPSWQVQIVDGDRATVEEFQK